MNDPADLPRKHFLFDAYGTLFDVHSAVRRHIADLGDKATHVSAVWRERQLQYSWVHALAGDYIDFAQITCNALDYALKAGGIDDGALRERLLGAYQVLDAYPDVEAALNQVREHGFSTAVFSNATVQMLNDALGHAGLMHLLDQVVSIDPIATYKPSASAYAHAEHELKVSPQDVRFFSSNAWDVFGARKHGWVAYWINRNAQPGEYGMAEPTTFESLQSAVRFAVSS